MASVAAGRDEEAFKWYLTAVEVRISWLRTGHPGHVCPKGSRGWKHSPGQHQHVRGSKLFPSASLWCFPSPRLGNSKVLSADSKGPAQEPPGAIFPLSLISSGEKPSWRGQIPRASGATDLHRETRKLTVSWPFASV